MNFLFITRMDLPPLAPMHPSRLCNGPQHQTNIIPNVVGGVTFVSNLELPIPWRYILPHEQYIFLKNHLCGGIDLNMANFKRSRLNGKETWLTHCHCPDEKSLQCIAASQIIGKIVNEFMAGMYFNVKHMFYRGYVNNGLPEQLLYQGSVLFRGQHLIYVKCMTDEDSHNLRYLQVPGMNTIYCNANYSNFFILVCESCKNETETQAYSCAYHTKKWLHRGLKLCKRKSRRESLLEKGRQRQLVKFYKFQEPITHFNGFF